MPFYEYRQNNSGGDFTVDHYRGISVTVTVEASDAFDANRRAEAIGLYFDGVGDCACCGERWSSASDDSYWAPPLDAPDVEYAERDTHWVEREAGRGNAASHYVHYKDGTVVGYGWTQVGRIDG